MAFSSGTFSLVAGNPVVTGTTISSTVQNNTMTDVATGLSTCVLKDGTQATTASVPFVFGIAVTTGATTPSTTFACFNTTATTVNAFGAATTLNIGAATGTCNLKNATVALTGALTITKASGAATFTQTASTASDGAYHTFIANSNSAIIGQEGTTPLYGGASGDFIVYNNGVLRVSVSTAGVVKIPNLAGVGSRTVVVDANGVLSAP